MPLSRYLKSFPDHDRTGFQILFSTRKGSVVRVSDSLLASAGNGTLAEADQAVLRRLELWVDDPAEELEEMANLVDLTNSRSNKFMATVLLTLECNLACPYCFEDHFRGDHVMSDETVRLLIAHIKREQIDMGRDVELSFYGGEPLMALPRLKEIAGALQNAAMVAGTEFSCNLVTNATLLTRSVVEELLPFGLTSAQITLDGPEYIHNSQRPFVSGRGSFKAIVANINSVYELINIKPGANFSRENYHEFPAMLDALLEAGIVPAKLGSVQFSPIHPKSGGHTTHYPVCAIGSEPWLIDAGIYLRKETLLRNFSVDKLSMGICMIELANNLVVNVDGSIYKCPALMGWPEFAIGTLAEGINDYRESHNLNVWKNDECLECAYLPLCFGGCRFFRMLKNGAIDGVDCRRAMLDASLETIVRQDLGF